jgi:hypothetical protein
MHWRTYERLRKCDEELREIADRGFIRASAALLSRINQRMVR